MTPRAVRLVLEPSASRDFVFLGHPRLGVEAQEGGAGDREMKSPFFLSCFSQKLLENRRERRENKARGGEKPECTRGYMRILSRRATPLSQAQ